MKLENEVLLQITRWAKINNQVRAVVLTGSRANPNAKIDALSDYDFALYVTDLSAFQNNDNWLDEFGIIMVRWPLRPRTTCDDKWLTRLVLFENGVRMDFQVTDDMNLAPADADMGYRVLVDKDGIAARFPAASYKLFNRDKPRKEEFEELINEFWWDAVYVAKYLWRDELPFAKYMMESELRVNYLNPLVEWTIALNRGWNRPATKYGNRFRVELDKETWLKYTSSYAGADIEQNWGAFLNMLDIFRILATGVASALGFQYPVELDRRVTKYCLNIQQLNSND